VAAPHVSAARLTVHKAFAYITHRDRLLVFRHPNTPEAGIQVPAGTVEPGESPRDAVLREAFEETGLEDLTIEAALGQRDFDMTPFERRELYRRHFFHLIVTGEPPETWRHEERHRSDGGSAIPFDFFWVRLPHEVPQLIAGHGDLLYRLSEPEATSA
jgi:8-oxo-dGTP diphosphatase